ncbi:MAG TPA: type II toxin-antitoxin system prevent-host-death family antitoxin [Chloroflexia bacterium]
MSKNRVIKVVSATDAKNRFGDLIKSAYMREEHLIIKRDGIPVMAIVPIADYERLMQGETLPDEIAEDVAIGSRTGRAHASLVGFLDRVQAHMPEVPEEEANQDIAEAIREVRAEQRRAHG